MFLLYFLRTEDESTASATSHTVDLTERKANLESLKIAAENTTMFTKLDMSVFVGEEARGDFLGRESFGRRSLRRISQAVKSKVSKASKQGSLDLGAAHLPSSMARDGAHRSSFRYKDERDRVPTRAIEGDGPLLPPGGESECTRTTQPQERATTKALPRLRLEGGFRRFLRPSKALADARRKDSWRPSGRRTGKGSSRPRRMSIDEAELLSLKRKLEGDLVMKAYRERRMEFIGDQAEAAGEARS